MSVTARLRYGSEIVRGLDVLQLKPSRFLSANEIAAANQAFQDEVNPQTQYRQNWPAVPLVARAYLDQLVRDGGIAGDRARSVRRALDKLDQHRAAPSDNQALASDLLADAGTAQGRNVERLKAVAGILVATAPAASN